MPLPFATEFAALDAPRLRSDLRLSRPSFEGDTRRDVRITDAVFRGLTTPGFQLGADALQILRLLDGQTPAATLFERVQERFGVRLSTRAVEQLLSRAGELQLLDTVETRRRRDALEQLFARQAARPCLGSLFPLDPAALARALTAAAASNPEAARSDPEGALAMLIPHAGIDVSGRCAARAVRQLCGAALPSLYIVLGPNHVHPSPAPRVLTVLQPFATPFGTIPVDREATETLMRSSGGLIEVDHLSHHREHSIEAVLPWIQWLHRQSQPEKPFSIVPLLLTGKQHYPDHTAEPEGHRLAWETLGRSIGSFASSYRRRDALRSAGSGSRERVMVIASGDLTHWGPRFEFVPFPRPDEASFLVWDAALVDALTAGSADRWLAAWASRNACAGRPVYTALCAFPGARWIQRDYGCAVQGEHALSFGSFTAHLP